jgi:hypothetical protein
MKEPLHNIVMNIDIVMNAFMHIKYNFSYDLYRLNINPQWYSPFGDMTSLRIPPIPFELLIRDSLIGDRPASIRSNLKKKINIYE